MSSRFHMLLATSGWVKFIDSLIAWLDSSQSNIDTISRRTMSRPQDGDRNQEATVYMGNLDERCTDALVWELMLQAGPVVNVHLPKDRVSMSHQGYGFCEFLTEDDAEYACKIMNQIKLYGKPIRVNKASSDRKQVDIGANLFIGNLDANVDERMLYDTFSTFGTLVQTAKIARNPTTGQSNGYGFVAYESFEAADTAIESMNGQFLMNKAITVQYAFKKDGKGERHGTPAERLLAAQARKNNALPSAIAANVPAPPPSAPNPMRYNAQNSMAPPSLPNQQPTHPPSQFNPPAHPHQHQVFPGGAQPTLPNPTAGYPAKPPSQPLHPSFPGPPPSILPMGYRPMPPNNFQPPRSFPPPPVGFAGLNGHHPPPAFNSSQIPAPPPGFGGLPSNGPPPGFAMPQGHPQPHQTPEPLFMLCRRNKTTIIRGLLLNIAKILSSFVAFKIGSRKDRLKSMGYRTYNLIFYFPQRKVVAMLYSPLNVGFGLGRGNFIFKYF
ncbi:hypothetical protein O181_041677 [Austropuccinia psidii MF-1]|uniref:Splicing factor 3B subunit 4 n=2 Tax=Pucciniales TaxID=5258 RepID=A0A9Q3DL86_9BASI|nr:hypothetical protein [Austropuccinia psidii MF-1]